MRTVDQQTENVYTALLAFHAESPALQKTKLNPAFRSKYIALEHLISEVTPLLTKHGLLWATFPESSEGEPVLRYELTHAISGTKVEGRMPLHSKGNLPQDQGSAITYARRYSMMAVLNLAADEDDDGNRASRARSGRSAPANGNGARVTAPPATQSERVASANQRGLINAKASEKHLEPVALLNLVRAAIERPPVEIEPEQATAALNRILDRLPAKHVDTVLALIADADHVDLAF